MNKKMMFVSVIALLVLAAVGGIFYFSGKSVAPAPATGGDGLEGPTVGGSSEVAVAPEKEGETIVLIKDFSFSPRDITVTKGSSVRWVNDETVGHDVVGDDASVGIKSPIMPKGESYAFTFDKVGVFGYHCGIHPSMKGSVTVK